MWGITGNLPRSTRWASYVGQGIGFLMISYGIIRIMTGQPVGGIWMALIGWFLVGAARSSYEQVMLKEALSGVRVDQVMTTDVLVITADTSVRQFVDNHLLRHEYACYPVVNDGDVIGVIGSEEVR